MRTGSYTPYRPDREHRQVHEPDHASGESTVARTLAVLTGVAFALHYRYGETVLEMAAFMPADPLRNFGFPILGSALLAADPVALVVALVGFVLCASPLERRLGSGWTWALFFWGHTLGIVTQLVAPSSQLPTYRTWGPNAGILALLVTSAALAGHFKRHHDADFEVEPSAAPRGSRLLLFVYIAGTLVAFALDRDGSLGISGPASLAGMVVGVLGAWTYRSGSSVVKLFQLAGPLARTAVILVAVLAGATHRKTLLEKFRSPASPVAVTSAGLEAIPATRSPGSPPVAAAPSREPSESERKLDRFLEQELGARELVFATIDPADHTFALAGGSLWVSGKWVPAAMLWDDEGFSAAGAGVTVRIRKPSPIDGSVAVLVNGAPIEAWPDSRLSAVRLREIAAKPPEGGR